MSFRQKDDTPRKWNAFYQANEELIEAIGLPWATIETLDRFADLLHHRAVEHHEDPTHFFLDDLDVEKRKLFRVLVVRYVEAGFSGFGMDSMIVGGDKAFIKLARKYPAGFTGFSKWGWQRVNEAPSPLSEEWWLDSSGLPDLLWARLTVYSDGSAEVLDLDGTYHDFASREEAVDWLSEDEYSRMDDLIEDGLLPDTTTPPSAPSEAELVLQMLVHSARAAQSV
jgi:hypothetical protein